VAEAKARLANVARELGLPWGERKRTYNSRLAQETGKWAETKGRGDAFHCAVFHAYFVEGVNIAKAEELVKLAVKVGLSGPETEEVLKKRAYSEAVDADWALSRKMGISAVPTFALDNRGVVGAQPYEVLERLLEEGGMQRKGNKP
jgi:predicted DsbA family dithiol-disulfide isomerase